MSEAQRVGGERRGGGHIPGAPGLPAWSLAGASPSAIPVLIAVPHAGRSYPRALLAEMRHPDHAAPRLEDRLVDVVAERVATETGAPLLVAHAPRALIDLNRSPDDVDWDMFAREGRPECAGAGAQPSRRARSGLGLIPRRLPGIGEIWRRRHQAADLAERIEAIHASYHACLGDTLGEVRARWGAVLLLDLHSMPPLPRRAGAAAARMVVGDRFGASSHGSLTAAAFAELAREGIEVAHNRPYAGGYVLERHADPARGVHAMQLEIDRSLYLDAVLREPGAGLEPTVQALVALVRRLSGAVAELGQAGQARQAAE